MSQLVEEIVRVSQKGTNRSTIKITNYKQAIGLALVSDFKSKEGHCKNSKEEFYTELFQESFDECCFYLHQLQDYVEDDKEPEKLEKIEKRLQYSRELVGKLVKKNTDPIIRQIKDGEKASVDTACYILVFMDFEDLAPSLKTDLESALEIKIHFLKRKLQEVFSGKSEEMLNNIARLTSTTKNLGSTDRKTENYRQM